MNTLQRIWRKDWPLFLSWLGLIAYLPLTRSFFWQDDLYFLRLAQISSVRELALFFSPVPGLLSTPMYRPLTSQFFFFVMKSIFGLQAGWWYFVSILLTGVLFFAVWKWLKAMELSPRVRIVTQLLFAFSATHFYRISYLSAVQEIVMSLFVVGALYFSARKKTAVVLLFFFLGLLSKETAIVLLPLLAVQMLYRREWRWKEVIYAGLMGVSYMLLRFGVYGVDRVGGEHYAWIFAPSKVVHTGIWYTLWSLGLPELTINYVGSGFRLLPHFWTDFPEHGQPVIGSFLLTLVAFAAATIGGSWKRVVKKEKKWFASLAFAGVFMILGLLPVLFLPDHKFPLGQTLGLLGLSLGCGFLFEKARRGLLFLALASFIFANLVTVAFSYQRHYAIARSSIAKKVYDALAPQKAEFSEKKGLYFLNDPRATHPIWGSSKQIDQAINSEHFAQVVFGKAVPIRFEDTTKKEDLSQEIEWVELESRDFLD